jgi:YidC/Oxa1 family membrane protein insertase
MISFFKTIIYIPLYNLLMVFLHYLPGHDAGIAIVLLTILVKLILYPVSKKAAVTQFLMKKHDPELQQIKDKYKDNKEEQAVQIMAFYKKYQVNPFSSILTIFIQIPIIYSLYYIFLHSGLPQINTDLVYHFITPPESVSMNFLGFIDVASKNVYLALLAALSTYYQIKYSSATPTAPATNEKGFGNDLARSMATQMKYTFPIIVFFISWKISGAVALYWFVSNLFTIAQDYWIKRGLNMV